MKRDIKQIGRLRVICREGTMDYWVVDELKDPKLYALPLDLNPADVVLDIGLNIGVFSVFHAKYVREIIGFEPFKANYALAVENIELNKLDNVEARNQAVVGNDDKARRLYLNGGKNMGNHSLVEFPKREFVEVEAVNINELIKEYGPTKLKIDCEGAEVEILRGIEDWGRVEGVAMEFHGKELKDETGEVFAELKEILQGQFKEVTHKGGYMSRFGCMIYARGRK